MESNKNAKRTESFIIPTLKDEHNILYYANKEKANIIAQNLQNSQQYDDQDEWTNQIRENVNNILERQDNERENEQEHNIKLTPYKILKLTREQRPYKAPGQDGIQIKHLKKLPKKK